MYVGGCTDAVLKIMKALFTVERDSYGVAA